MIASTTTPFMNTGIIFIVIESNMSSSGSVILADSLRVQGIEYMFGIVGIPIVEVAYSAQTAGINYIGMRNEQSVSIHNTHDLVNIVQ